MQMTPLPSHAQDDAIVMALEPLTSEIVDALRYFRGACHRNQVIEFIIAAHRRAGEVISEGLKAAVIAAFERHLGVGDDARPFRLPFGPGSNRWALSDGALRG